MDVYGLSNTDQLLQIVNSNGLSIDSVHYDDGWANSAADGNGASLALCDLYGDNSLSTAWIASTDSVTLACNPTCNGSFTGSTSEFVLGSPGTAELGCILGCTDPLATNFDSIANADDGSCVYYVAGCTSADILISEGHTSGDPEDFIEIQNISSSDCDMSGWLLDDSDGFSDFTFPTAVIPAGGFWYGDEDASTSGTYDANGVLLSTITGSFGSGLSSGGDEIWLTDGTDTLMVTLGPSVGGSTFSQSFDVNGVGCYTYPTPGATNNSCLTPTPGCTDPLADNYDATANYDDGSCTYPLQPMVNLFFSEYAEGSSNNKYFEIYNPTGDTVALSSYAYPNVSNSPSTPGVYEYWNSFDAGAVILPFDVYVVAHGSADAAILAEADETHNYLSNGDDGYGLVYGDQTSYQVIDWLGDWNGDPGSGWDVAGVTNATQNHTLVRKCDVTMGDTSWTNAAGTDSLNSQWIVYPNETWTFLGEHCVSPILGLSLIHI